MDAACRKALILGFLLMAFSIPLGITLEVLHAYKSPAYLQSPLRRELWTLAHAHGNMLGLTLLVYASVARRAIRGPRRRARISLLLRLGAVSIPFGFLLGGVLNEEGDPSAGIVLVPVGAVLLLLALFSAALATARPLKKSLET